MNAVNGKRAAPGYNAQVSVDTASRLIVGEYVTEAPADQQEFSRQHRNVEANLPENADRTYVADAGYNSLDELEYIEEARVDVVLADPRPEHRDGGSSSSTKRYTRSAFPYDAERDCYRCPGGQELTYWHRDQHRGHPQRVYRCVACVGCTHAARCLHPRANNAPYGEMFVNLWPSR